MGIEGKETTGEMVERLRKTAAEFRAQAASLEVERDQERRTIASRSFAAFDTNKDGEVGVVELQEGLGDMLRESLIKEITKNIGRKPNPEEVEERIAQLPGGTLFPDDVARKLIEAYDSNGDGVLEESEFVPTEELRRRLDSMLRERRDEEQRAKAAEREREMSREQPPGKAGGRDVATARDKALSAVPYLLPLMDGLQYSNHLFRSYPEQTAWAQPFRVILAGLESIPFLTTIIFFGMIFVANNQQINKLVRFNMRQAINFDLTLIPPSIFAPLIDFSLGEDAYKLQPLTDVASDIFFVTLVVGVAYSVGSSALGYFPNKIPFYGRINRDNPDNE